MAILALQRPDSALDLQPVESDPADMVGALLGFGHRQLREPVIGLQDVDIEALVD